MASVVRRNVPCAEAADVTGLTLVTLGEKVSRHNETASLGIPRDWPLLFRMELPAGEACCSFASQRPRLT